MRTGCCFRPQRRFLAGDCPLPDCFPAEGAELKAAVRKLRTAGAFIGNGNMLLQDTGVQEGRPVCFRKGQAKAALRLLHAGRSKMLRKICRPLPVYVIAAAVYVRSHDHAEVPDLTAVQGGGETKGFNGNPCSFPARMQDTENPRDGIIQEHRHAVSNRNDRNQGPVTGYKPVPLLTCGFSSRSNRIYLTGMDKLKRNGFVSA